MTEREGRHAQDLRCRAEGDRRPARVLRQLLALAAYEGAAERKGRRENKQHSRERRASKPSTRASSSSAASSVRSRSSRAEIGTLVAPSTPIRSEHEQIVEIVLEKSALPAGSSNGWTTASRASGAASSSWEPPARFSMSWYPGHDPSEATDLEVRLQPRRRRHAGRSSSTGAGKSSARRGARKSATTTTPAGARCSATTRRVLG